MTHRHTETPNEAGIALQSKLSRVVPDPQSRISYLDGLRGVAIASVIFFHVFSHWAPLMPYGLLWADVALFKYGWYGVQLFFMISGYVILMTLDNSRHLYEFAFRRWKRLFPGMLICSTLLFATHGLWTVKLNPMIDGTSLLPGISFIAPGVWSWATGRDFQMLEGAFWSLFVEAKFYLIAALIYFWLGRRWLIPALFSGCMTYWVLNYWVAGFSGVLGTVHAVLGALSLDYFGWFAVGAAVYQYRQTKRESWLVLACIMLGFVCIVGKLSDKPQILASLVTGLVFVVPAKWPLLQRALTIRPLLWLGAVSYPLYLLHENASVSLTNEMVHWFAAIPSFLALTVALTVIAGVAACVAFFCEPWVQTRLDATLGRSLRQRLFRQGAGG